MAEGLGAGWETSATALVRRNYGRERRFMPPPFAILPFRPPRRAANAVRAT